MFKKQEKEKLSYGIVGLGRFGETLALELAKSGADIMVMDIDERKVSELRDYTENAFVMDALSVKALEETGIQNCDVAVVCIGERMDASVMITLNLVNLGIPKVISKAISQPHGEILKKLGAEVVFPERDMGIRLAKRLETSRMLDYIHLSEKLNISKMMVPSKYEGKTVKEVDLRKNYSLNIVAVESQGVVKQVISPDYVFKKNDILFLAGDEESFEKLIK